MTDRRRRGRRQAGRDAICLNCRQTADSCTCDAEAAHAPLEPDATDVADFPSIQVDGPDAPDSGKGPVEGLNGASASCARPRETPPVQEPAPAWRTPSHGHGQLRSGQPANRGGAPTWFRRRLRELGSHPRTLGYLTECLEGRHGWKAFMAGLQHCLKFGLGEVQRVEMRGSLSTIDFSRLSDEAISRIASGEHPLAVLGSSLNALPPGRSINPDDGESPDDNPEDAP